MARGPGGGRAAEFHLVVHEIVKLVYLGGQVRRHQVHVRGPRQLQGVQVTHDVGGLVADQAAGAGVHHQGGRAPPPEPRLAQLVHLPAPPPTTPWKASCGKDYISLCNIFGVGKPEATSKRRKPRKVYSFI